MTKQDDAFLRQFGVVLALLVIFAFIAYFLGTGLAKGAKDRILASASSTLERIRPVGEVQVAEGGPSAQAKPSAPEVSSTASAAGQPAAAAPGAAREMPASAPQPAQAAQPPAGSAAPPVATASAEEEKGRSPETVYQTVCIACHSTGVANAPKTGDKTAWAPRAEKGLDALVSSVMHGKNAMPPKGGNPTLTEPEIRRTVRWLVAQAGLTVK